MIERSIEVAKEKKDTFADDWSREWEEITRKLNPNKDKNPEGELPDEEKAYRQGLDEAWELARKIYYYVQDGGFNSQEMMVIFDTDDPCKALKKHTALEAVKRYEEYKKETASERPQRNKKAV